MWLGKTLLRPSAACLRYVDIVGNRQRLNPLRRSRGAWYLVTFDNGDVGVGEAAVARGYGPRSRRVLARSRLDCLPQLTGALNAWSNVLASDDLLIDSGRVSGDPVPRAATADPLQAGSSELGATTR
jgi:hypothetical protein